MAVTETITCDICGIRKGEANHWLLWRPADGPPGGIQFAPWDPTHFRAAHHLCGDACAARLLARTIDDWRILQDAARPPAVDPYRLPRVH